MLLFGFVFFFKQKTAYEMRISDWSSDVCSSDLTVAENMGYSLRIAGVPKPERSERVAAVARMLGLSDYLSRKPSQLSGGQRQRVAIGRAIIREPGVLLFDEPDRKRVV